MSRVVEKLDEAQKFAMSTRPKIGGFPYLAEVLRQAGVQHNYWSLPSCQSVYVMKDGNVIQQGAPLITGLHEIPRFDEQALVKALRIDQSGQSTFLEFLQATWKAGVVSYDVDFIARKVTYCGALGEKYVEAYPGVEVKR